MKNVLKLLLMGIAYLAIFILGATSGIIHPACYAYVGAILPLLFAFVYLYTAKIIKGFGVPTFLNGFILVLFLLAGEADWTLVVGFVILTALSEILRYLLGYNTKKGVRWGFVPFAFSFFAYTMHWWTDTAGSLAAAVEEMPAGYDKLMVPVIENVPLLVVVLILTIPISMLSIRIAERTMNR